MLGGLSRLSFREGEESGGFKGGFFKGGFLMVRREEVGIYLYIYIYLRWLFPLSFFL